MRSCFLANETIQLITHIIQNCNQSQLFAYDELAGYTILFIDNCVYSTQNTNTYQTQTSTLVQAQNQKLLETLMNIATQFFNNQGEPCLILLSTLVNILRGSLQPYYQQLMRYFLEWFKTDITQPVFKLLCELCGDISLEIGQDFNQYIQECLQLIIQAIQRPNMKLRDQASILEVIGDFISTCPNECQQSVPQLINLLADIINVPIDEEDFELMESVCQLRQSGLYVYMNIFQSYKFPDIAQMTKYPLQLIFISVSHNLFNQFNQTFKEYLANCLFDVAQNSFAKGSQDFLREQQNGNLKKIAQILMNAIENKNVKQLMNRMIYSI